MNLIINCHCCAGAELASGRANRLKTVRKSWRGSALIALAFFLRLNVGQVLAQPAPTGACCIGSQCFETIPGQPDAPMTMEFCTANGDFYLGDNSTCSAGVCLAACCVPSEGSCITTDIRSCEGAGIDGIFQGLGTTCATTTCPFGGCCLGVNGAGGCAETTATGDAYTQSVCTSEGGMYLGDGSSCESNPACPTGACCLGSACYEFHPSDNFDDRRRVTAEFCRLAEGIYLGDNVDCSPGACLAACCVPSTGECISTDIDSCEGAATGGIFQGLGTSCATTMCPFGACCLGEGGVGGCAEETGGGDSYTQTTCEEANGTYLGDASTCGASPACPTGACCIGSQCFDTHPNDTDIAMTSAFCAINGDFYLGDESACSAGACFGACCLPTGECLFEDIRSCEGAAQNGLFHGLGTSCDDVDCTIGACTTCCECTQLNEEDCDAIGGEFHGMATRCDNIDFAPDTTPPTITCPGAVSLSRGDKLCNNEVQDLLDSVTASDNCGEPTIASDMPECGLPYGTTTVTFTAADECGNTASCSADVTIGPAPRVDISKKGSLLAFSKIDLRWNAAGALTQDTFLTLINDYPDDVYVQMYFVNGDAALDPLFSNTQPPVLLTEGEPGWNWVDCQVLLTPDQPVYWSASTGSPLGCQPFTILDPDLGSGAGRPAPDTNDGSRALRGFVLAFAVNQSGAEIQWNHLSGKATIVDYANITAWEYDAFAFQAGCRAQGDEPPDCTLFDDQGVCCTAEVIPGHLGMDGFQYDYAFDALLLDFFGVGSQALSGPATPTTVDTDLTLHILSADLRQESDGPVTTKAHFDIWNSNERKLSNTRRCLTCWDQTLLSQYNAPNSFLRENLQSDKGKARIDGKQADECEENCFRDEQGEPLDAEELIELLGDLFNPLDFACSEDAALLGLAAKYLAFSGPAGQRAVAGSNLVGMGTERALIQYDVVSPPGTLREESYNRIQGDAPRGAGRLRPPVRKSGANR